MKLKIIKSKEGKFDKDSVLTNPTQQLSDEEIKSDEVQSVLDAMLDKMIKTQDLGLSANQVGYPYSMLIYRDLDSYTLKEMINPVIKAKAKKVVSQHEGCLSLPGWRCHVRRSKIITVDYQDREGKPQRLKVKHNKMQAFILQHEIDHLAGILMTDRATQSFPPR